MKRSRSLFFATFLLSAMVAGRRSAAEECCCMAEPCTPFSDCRLQGSLGLGGWLSSGIYANAWGAGDNGPVGSKEIGDGYTVQQMWLYGEKAVDTSGYGWDWGGRVDCNFGTDSSGMQAFGDGSWDANWNTSDDYGFAMPQLYGEVGYGDLTIKAGRFLSIVGWEYVEDPPNFFSSNSYPFFYAEPATHTGVLGTYEASDSLVFHAGWTNGWDAGFTDNGGASTFLGGVVWTVNDGFEVTYTCSVGTLGDGEGDLYMHGLALELALTERLTWILHNDLGVQPNLPGGDDALWVGIVQYLQYEVTDTVDVGLRIEWFQDRDGTRVDPGAAWGDFYELTAGLNWHPNDCVMLRPEIRYDWFGRTAAPGSMLFDNGTEAHQLSGGFDLIVSF
jgi:hypothetical protein